MIFNDSDGINISSQAESSSDGRSGLHLITANKSIKISSLNPIMNIIKGHKESEKTSVYYFEVFIMSGDCAVGFIPAVDNNSDYLDTIFDDCIQRDAISVGNCGHLIHHPGAEFPLLRNNSEQNGETIGCGIIFGAEPSYFFTHNGMRIDVEAYGINSRLSSLQTALVPTVALSNSNETFVRTNFGFHSDTPFLWDGDVNDNLCIISHSNDGGPPVLPPPSSARDNIIYPSLPQHTHLPRYTSNEFGGSLLSDEVYPPPNFTRGNTLSGSIIRQKPVPPVVEYTAASASNNDKGRPPRRPNRPSWMTRRRASMPNRERDGSMLSGDDRRMIETIRGRMREKNVLGSDLVLVPPRFASAQNHDRERNLLPSGEPDLVNANTFGGDENYLPPNFSRGSSLGPVPPTATVEYVMSASMNEKTKLNRKSSWRNRRRASMPERRRDGSLISEEDRLVMFNTLRRGRLNDEMNNRSAFHPPWLKNEENRVRRSFVAESSSPSSVKHVFGESSAVDAEYETVQVVNDIAAPTLTLTGNDFDLNDMKELATELTRATSASETNHSSVSELIALCESKLDELNDKITNSMGEDFGELFTVHDLITEAIRNGRSWSQNRKSQIRMAGMNESGHSLLSTTSSQEQTAVEGKGGVQQDIYGILCHLRGRKERTRIIAVWSLLEITRSGSTHESEQIIESEGFCSLLTLFQSSAESEVLMTLSALALVNLVTSYTKPVENRKVILVVDCLHYLIRSPSFDADESGLSPSPFEVFNACKNAMTYLWVNYVELKLCSLETSVNGKKCVRDCFEIQRTPRRRSLQDEDDIDYCYLLNSFTSLAVMSATLDYRNVDGLEVSTYYGFADVVRSICSVEACHGLAMKEDVMNILLKWLRSNDKKLELNAAAALRDVTVSQNSYTTGWVHSELLHDGSAITDILERLSSPNLEVRRCMAEIVSRLTGLPHTRAAIVDVEGIKLLGQVLVGSGCEDDSAVTVAVANSLLNIALLCSGVNSSFDHLKLHSNKCCTLQ